MDIENVDTIYQMELAEQQNCDSLKDTIKLSTLLISTHLCALRLHALISGTMQSKWQPYLATFMSVNRHFKEWDI